MNGTAIGLIVGLAYGAVLGVWAYRWYTRERAMIDGRLESIRQQAFNLNERLVTVEKGA